LTVLTLFLLDLFLTNVFSKKSNIILTWYSSFLFTKSLKQKHSSISKTTTSFLQQTYFLKSYFMQNERIWQEGLLIDFLQKKVTDKWTRSFLITSSYLVNERLFFDWVVRFYMELVLWPGYRNRIFEFLNIGSTLFITVILLLSTLLLLTFPYIIITFFL
jgi:hypothetical protein